MSDALPSDPAELREMIAALEVENARMTKENARLAATLRAHDLLIEALRARIAKLQRQRFGPSSEKIEREIEQLVLALEDLQVAAAEGDTIEPEDPDADASVSADTEVEAEEPAEAPKPRRRPRVAEGTPRERRVLGPGEACPDCGGDLRIVGQDVSELVDLIAAKLKVIEIARPKASCRRCERMVQAPAPSRPIPRSMAGPGLLAHVLVSKFDDHVPLYRQAEVFARMGADIPDTTLVDWCGRAMKALQPVIERIEACVMACDLLHADDTPIRVLDRGRRSAGLGRGVKQGRIWAYVRDQRPWAGPEPPGVVYRFSPDRKGEHPRRHLAGSAGVLQADAYSGFRELYEPGTDGTRQFREAACWAHLRRAFHDVWTATQSAIARDALDRIGALYDVERRIAGRGAAERLAARAAHSAPKVEAFRAWSEAQLARLPGKSDLAKAFRYALKRWPSFTLFLEDGRVAIDNNAAERAMRPIGVGREPLALRGLGHRRRDPRPRHDPHRDRQDERPRPPGLPRRPPRPHPRPQGQPDRRAAALELDAQPHRGSGRRLNRGPNRVVTHLDEVRVVIRGQVHWLWRAVDQHGVVSGESLQRRRDTRAARRLLVRLLKKQGWRPRRIVTDRLPSYGAAKREVAPGLEHRAHKGLNDRAENSHLPLRRRERQCRASARLAASSASSRSSPLCATSSSRPPVADPPSPLAPRSARRVAASCRPRGLKPLAISAPLAHRRLS